MVPTSLPIDPADEPLERGATATKGDVVFHHVRREILLGIVAPGTQLLEQHIAATRQCSQGTVREALMRLEQEGFVERRGYRGTVVVEPGAREVAEMARIRESIECLGLRQSVPGFSGRTLDRLTRITEQMDRSLAENDPYTSSELDRRFHLCMLQEARLPTLEPIFVRCALNLHRFTYAADDERPRYETLGEDHRALIEVVRGGDAGEAERAMSEHIRYIVRVGAPRLHDL